jgi:hypothetical protein
VGVGAAVGCADWQILDAGWVAPTDACHGPHVNIYGQFTTKQQCQSIHCSISYQFEVLICAKWSEERIMLYDMVANITLVLIIIRHVVLNCPMIIVYVNLYDFKLTFHDNKCSLVLKGYLYNAERNAAQICPWDNHLNQHRLFSKHF